MFLKGDAFYKVARVCSCCHDMKISALYDFCHSVQVLAICIFATQFHLF